ncbi:hypothetical protein [Hamadaea tsunoensis]|uniref:hypothetical protein n=1 Tax=Hamadaea tsunoensis TaxID=53368 RepID=UPI0012FC9986|nr:hypothetical protein [Hamadaea tsunoensis]
MYQQFQQPRQEVLEVGFGSPRGHGLPRVSLQLPAGQCVQANRQQDRVLLSTDAMVAELDLVGPAMGAEHGVRVLNGLAQIKLGDTRGRHRLGKVIVERLMCGALVGVGLTDMDQTLGLIESHATELHHRSDRVDDRQPFGPQVPEDLFDVGLRAEPFADRVDDTVELI